MLNFKRFEFNSSQKVEVLDGNKTVMIINIEYYDKSNIQLVKNLEILNITNELLPIHYSFEIKKNNYLKKLITFSSPKKLNVHLKSLDISSNDLNNIYNSLNKELNTDITMFEITLLIQTTSKEVLYTLSKVYKKEFKY